MATVKRMAGSMWGAIAIKKVFINTILIRVVKKNWLVQIVQQLSNVYYYIQETIFSGLLH